MGDAPFTVVLACDYSLSYVGGAQVAFMRQVRALVAQGWRVVVVAPEAEAAFATDASDLLVPVNVRVRVILPGLDLPVLEPRKHLVATLRSLVSSNGAEAIVVHSEFALAAAALEVGAEAHIPVLQTVHTFFWRAPRALGVIAPLVHGFHRWLTGLAGGRYRGSTAINNALRSMTLRVATRADVVLSPSAHQAQQLRDAGAASTVAFSNVVEDAPAVSVSPPRVNGPLRLVWVGRFAPEKRLDVMLAAMEIVRTELGEGAVELHVAGGEHKPAKGVVFHGRVSSSEVSKLIASADAALITSLGFDNQPMVALEAFSLGRGVIVTDPVLAHEFAPVALGTDTPDAVGLAATIVALVRDRARLVELGSAAAAYAAARQAPAHAARLRELITAARG